MVLSNDKGIDLNGSMTSDYGGAMSSALIPINEAHLRAIAEPWPFAIANRERIDTYWAEAQRLNPSLWNGKILIGRGAKVEDGLFSGVMSETDFASLIGWKAFGSAADACHIYGMPGLITSDGALVYGVMGSQTYNAGKIYPPGGSLDPADLRDDGTIDILGSITREVAEETGLDAGIAGPRGLYVLPTLAAWTVVSFLELPMSLREVEERFAAHVANETDPELEGLWPIRNISDIRPEMPGYAAEMARFFCETMIR